MHIPDGYLSPSTCAALYGASAPFIYVASRRVKRLVAARLTRRSRPGPAVPTPNPIAAINGHSASCGIAPAGPRMRA